MYVRWKASPCMKRWICEVWERKVFSQEDYFVQQEISSQRSHQQRYSAAYNTLLFNQVHLQRLTLQIYKANMR